MPSAGKHQKLLQSVYGKQNLSSPETADPLLVRQTVRMLCEHLRAGDVVFWSCSIHGDSVSSVLRVN